MRGDDKCNHESTKTRSRNRRSSRAVVRPSRSQVLEPQRTQRTRRFSLTRYTVAAASVVIMPDPKPLGRLLRKCQVSVPVRLKRLERNTTFNAEAAEKDPVELCDLCGLCVKSCDSFTVEHDGIRRCSRFHTAGCTPGSSRRRHHDLTSWRSVSSKRIGNRDASGKLCVTTMRIVF